ncbi:MAG: IclR family transcriptional regulator [Akkermansiaceae bacterium]
MPLAENVPHVEHLFHSPAATPKARKIREIKKTQNMPATTSTSIEPESSQSSVPALDRSLDIIEMLSESPEGMTLSQISNRLEVPKNAVFRITQTLQGRGYLLRNKESMAFRLSGQWLKLATPRMLRLSLPEATRPAMTALRDRTKETVQLGVLSDLYGTIIDQVEGTQPLRIVVDLGLRFKLYNNAPGKLLLAHMSDKQRTGAISKIKLVANTPRTITCKVELQKECERILNQGYSVDYAEANEGIHCVAAPIDDGRGKVLGAIWISGPAKRLPKSSFAEVSRQVVQAAEQATRTIKSNS